MTPAEKSALIQRGLRFAVTGVFVTALHALVAVLFIHFISAPPPLANGVAFAVATVLSYVINTTWSFSARLHGRTLVRFLLVSVCGFFWRCLSLGLRKWPVSTICWASARWR